MPSDDLHTTWLFKLLDYEHYNVCRGDMAIGQVVVNHMDRSVIVQAYEEALGPELIALNMTYNQWRTWLRQRERPRLP